MMNYFTETGLLSLAMIVVESAFVAALCCMAWRKAKTILVGNTL